MEKELYIVRHGETELNRMRIVQGSGIDSHLNEKGRAQSMAFYNAYKYIDFDFVYTSALKRTVQTIHNFLLDGVPYKSLEELNEISWGTHEGKAPEPSLIEAYNKVVEKWLNEDYDAALPDAETPNELRLRLLRFVKEFKQNSHKKVLVCTHGRALRCLLTILSDEPLKEMEKYKHSNTGVFKLIFKEGTFVRITNNCTAHLNTEYLTSKDW